MRPSPRRACRPLWVLQGAIPRDFQSSLEPSSERFVDPLPCGGVHIAVFESNDPASTPDAVSPVPRPDLRRIFTKIAIALAAPVLFLGACEAALAIAGFGAPHFYGLPPGVSTYWIPFRNGAGEWVGYRRAFPRAYSQYPESRPLFAKEKPAGGFRVFTVGESTVEGSPYELGSFTDWLRVRMVHMMPGTPWRSSMQGTRDGAQRNCENCCRSAWNTSPTSSCGCLDSTRWFPRT